RWRRVRRERAGGGLLEDPAQRCAEPRVPAATVGLVIHEGVNDADHGETRTRRIGDLSVATIRVPAEDALREVQAAHGIRARSKFYAARGNVENICSTGGIEHVRASKETRKCLTVVTVTDETKAGVLRNDVCRAVHLAATAAKRNSAVFFHE